MGRTPLTHESTTSGMHVGGFAIPEDLRSVAERLERSRAMLALGDNWDGEGSLGYEEATWHRAAELIVDMATSHHARQWGSLPVPIISPSDEGSIDVQWRTPTRNVLINVPRESDEPVTFYAHDAENPKRDFGGELDPGPKNERLLAWLMT